MSGASASIATTEHRDDAVHHSGFVMPALVAGISIGETTRGPRRGEPEAAFVRRSVARTDQRGACEKKN